MSHESPHDLIREDEAARLLEVQPGQIAVLVDQGILTPIDDGAGGVVFRRDEVLAARLIGG